MEKTTVVLNNNKGEVQVFSDDIKAGFMDIAIKDTRLTVFHTEVAPAYEGKGFAKLLLARLVSYARENNLQIVPLCPYVLMQFRRHPEEYKDVWAK
ncbi:MAG: N-acetyltransferase [Chitinophagaceae bacterium]|nr:N-acetyltransferase [Chitinophagaceae bacterium]